MAPRKTPNQLSPEDAPGPSLSGPPSPSHPRSVSPSGGFANFFSKPGKWFNRKPSTGGSVIGSLEPSRSSTSSARKPKISHPTDPRPILASYQSDSRVSSGSRSVLDLSMRPPGSLDIPNPFQSPSSPSSPTTSDGDLRNLGRRAWSRSADDLGKFSSPLSSPIDASFHNKVTQYRNRSNSSAVNAPPSPSNSNVPQPFPSITTSSPLSASPPGGGISMSVSTPLTLEKPLQIPDDPHHVRSHSFTPRRPSKLSVSKSPSRKGSAPSERDIERDIALMKSRQLVMPPPPLIIEPSADAELDQDVMEPDAEARTKRTSQIVYHAGFINRLTELPIAHRPYQATNLALAKGWKPFKMELKGSKLSFYKPPSDRAAAVRDLFPTELVSTVDDPQEQEKPVNELLPDVRKRQEGGSRKKRAYWGRGTHPELVFTEASVEKGTFEALVHETVFATSILKEGSGEAEKSRWRDFASSVLLCLPPLVGREKFENEFTRCCAYIVSGGTVEDAAVRVKWLAGEYIRYHGAPADAPGWEEWRKETIPDFSEQPTCGLIGGMATSASTKAVFSQSPHLDSKNLCAPPDTQTPTFSPNLGTFSPRPDADGKLTSLMEALAVLPATPTSPSSNSTLHRRPGSEQNSQLWAALDREGLSREVLLMLDPHLVARTLGLFHRAALQEVPENLTAEYIINADTASYHNGQRRMSTTVVAEPKETPINPTPAALFGSEKSPHWLTKILLMQILGVDTSTGALTSTPSQSQISSPGRASEDRPVQTTSRTHSRSEVISMWARIGENCRLGGDECSWRAIAAALCSRPVARLDKAWKRVSAEALSIVDSWVHPGADGETANVQEPRMTPWGGAVKECVKQALDRSRGNDDDLANWLVEPFGKVRELFEGTRTAFSLCPRRFDPNRSEMSEEDAKMVAFWGELCAGNVRAGTLGSKFLHIEQFLSLSLAAEPRRKGLFEPFYWSQASSAQLPTHPLVPISFPQTLPTITLIDRGEIWHGRVENGPSLLNAADLQFLRTLEPRSNKRRSAGTKDLAPGFDGVDLLGSVLAIYDGELLLTIQRGGVESTPAPSRPVSFASSVATAAMEEASSPDRPRISRKPSIRMRPGPPERKPSVARRSSLPAISKRQSVPHAESSSDPPLRVLVHGGTVDRLVQILVHGLEGVSVSVADDNGEMPLREGRTRDLYVQHESFARVWWSVFRSFVTPLVFFELLRKRYVSSQSARKSIVAEQCLELIRSRMQVLDAMKEWILQGGGAQDILDDPQLYKTVRFFLDDSTFHRVPLAPAMDEPTVQQALSGCDQSLQSLASHFTAQTMRPTSRDLMSLKMPSGGPKSRHLGKDAPDIDRVDPEQLVEDLDAMAAAAFSNVNEEDLFVTADLLEVQMGDRMGWLLPRDPVATAEDIEVQTMYSHIMEVEPSSMISELSHGTLYRLLPPGIRSCIRAYGILRKWLISKLVAYQIGIRARQARMEKLLRALEVARLRNADTTSSGFSLVERPSVRSFVEAVLTSALVSVESRAHHRAWQNVAAARGVQCESLAILLRKPVVQISASSEPLTVDMSWLLERVLEIISIPDLLAPSDTGPSVVNFEKRRHICNLITSAPNIPLSSSGSRRAVDRRDFERLNNIEKEVGQIKFDQRGIRDEAHRESMQSTATGNSSARKAVRPFQKVIQMQQEKIKRDKFLRDRISKEKRNEQRTEKRDDGINKIVNPRQPPTTPQRQHRNKKSMSSAFFQFMRPISSAFTSDTDFSLVKKTPAELDFSPSGKPMLVLNIVDAKVSHFINNERSFTFQLDTEDGGHYLLQALSRRDMTKWLDTIGRVAKTAAQRRLTYLGSPKPQLADHLHNQSLTVSRDPRAVFGVELPFLLKREAANGEVLPGAIPFIIERCLYEVETRGLTEVGIYRIAGAVSEISALKEAFNREISDFETRLSSIRTAVRGLPRVNFDLLKRVAEHLDKVTDYEEHNHMTADALAIVFAPNLLRAPQNDFTMILANMGYTHKLVKSLITHFHVIFDENDQEVENDQDEDEFDEPILEEEEPEEDMPPSPPPSP
ncbi:hypothetical protein HWV62_1997 [Athelia sp. TMB]|nr:hypothetical protein HWV62_1997 [Athelia sp. TMB]